MNIIDEMAKDAIKDEYFIKLFNYAEKIYWNSFLASASLSSIALTPAEYSDLLTFADILSLSSNEFHRNIALKVISCLKCKYSDDIKYQYYARGIMIRLGNFPGYNILSSSGINMDLPLDLQIEKEFKQSINKDVYSDKIFTDSQYYVLEELLDKNHFSFSGPTSFGKSFVLTSFIKNLIMNQKRGLNIVFLVPTRALVSQTLKKFKDVINGMDNYFLSSSPEIPALLRGKNAHYIFVFTPERLLHYFSIKDNPTIEYVFVDEAQKILSEDTRSVIYYHAISLAERKSCKLFFSSPNINNVDIFLKLFNKTISETCAIIETPVCQSRVFVDMLDKHISLFSDLSYIDTIDYCLPNNLYGLIQHISENVDSSNPRSIIYCNTIDDTIECAKQMADYLKPKNSQKLNAASDEIAGFIHKDYYLVELIKKGVGFHFSKLPQKVRDIVESLYESGDINYLFCTSTLLEGVNLPAQNIFILNNQIGNRNLQSIDFWNLAGRAGRLAHELCGNVICVRWIDKDGRWNTQASIDIMKNKQLETIETEIITGKANFYRNLLHAAKGESFSRRDISESKRRIYIAYSNVLIAHYFDDQPSLLRNEFQKKLPNGTKSITEIEKSLSIPAEIICKFPLIKIKYQDEIWKSSPLRIPLLEEPNYDNCLNLLNIFYDIYHWNIEEVGGRNPLLPHGNKNFLKHYASLMTDWMNSKSINEIIANNIRKHIGISIKNGYSNSGHINLVPFDVSNKRHINIVINDIISEIDSIVRFTLKNYFENYYNILEARFGSGNCGQNWALYMEHGTTKKELIEIQKLGIPRHLSKVFLDSFGRYCKFNNNGDLVALDTIAVAESLKSRQKPEYSEIEIALKDNYILGNTAISN